MGEQTEECRSLYRIPSWSLLLRALDDNARPPDTLHQEHCREYHDQQLHQDQPRQPYVKMLGLERHGRLEQNERRRRSCRGGR